MMKDERVMVGWWSDLYGDAEYERSSFVKGGSEGGVEE